MKNYLVGNNDKLSTFKNSIPVGCYFYRIDDKKPIFKGNDNILYYSDGMPLETKYSGLYINKPINPPNGFAYFCTDRQTTEGASDGIMIYHKGDNVWVDALGRVVE